MERLPTMPLNARLLSGPLEDTMARWRQRRMGEMHPDIRKAGVRALALCQAIIDEFELYKASLEQELTAYDEAAKGAP